MPEKTFLQSITDWVSSWAKFVGEINLPTWAKALGCVLPLLAVSATGTWYIWGPPFEKKQAYATAEDVRSLTAAMKSLNENLANVGQSPDVMQIKDDVNDLARRVRALEEKTRSVAKITTGSIKRKRN